MPSTISAMTFNVVVLAGAVLAFLLLHNIDFFDFLYNQTRAYEDLELDELFNVFVVTVPALAIILAARSRRLAVEVDRRREAEDKAATLANFDPLTGLANRRMFQAEFRSRLKAAKASRTALNICIIDLDGFKRINDFYGHPAGDELLSTVAARLRNVIRDGDIAVRLGGDEFAIITGGNPADAGFFDMMKRLVKTINQPMKIGQYQLGVTCSIGVARFPKDGSDEELLMQCADQALYQAKATGKNRYALFDETLAQTIQDRRALEDDLRAALTQDSGAVVPYFQPIMELSSHRVIQFEVLARWNHPTRGLVEAAEFVDTAENIGMADQLYAIILRRACIAARSWDHSIAISVNLSPVQFTNRQLAEKTLEILREADFPCERLELEITESSIVHDFVQAQQVIRSLQKEGIRVSLDDFGTGYSGLRHLQKLTLDKIKIDRSFVVLPTSPSEPNVIVSAIIALGHNLGMTVVAEGIEDPSQEKWLTSHGCDLGQGFLYSRPLPLADAKKFILNENTGGYHADWPRRASPAAKSASTNDDET